MDRPEPGGTFHARKNMNNQMESKKSHRIEDLGEFLLYFVQIF